MNKKLLSLLFIGLFTSHTTFGMIGQLTSHTTFGMDKTTEVAEEVVAKKETLDNPFARSYNSTKDGGVWKDLLESHIFLFIPAKELLDMMTVSKTFSAFVDTFLNKSGNDKRVFFFKIPYIQKNDGTLRDIKLMPSDWKNNWRKHPLRSASGCCFSVATLGLLKICSLGCGFLGICCQEPRHYAKYSQISAKLFVLYENMTSSLREIKRPLSLFLEKNPHDNTTASHFFVGLAEGFILSMLAGSPLNIVEFNLVNCQYSFSFLKKLKSLKKITLPPVVYNQRHQKINIEKNHLECLPQTITTLNFSGTIRFSTLVYLSRINFKNFSSELTIPIVALN